MQTNLISIYGAVDLEGFIKRLDSFASLGNEGAVKLIICNSQLSDIRFEVSDNSSVSYINHLDRINIQLVASWAELQSSMKIIFQDDNMITTLAIYDMLNLCFMCQSKGFLQREMNESLNLLNNLAHYKNLTVKIADRRILDIEEGDKFVPADPELPIDSTLRNILSKWTSLTQ